MPSPGVAHPVHRLADGERVQHLQGRLGAFAEGVAAPGIGARSVTRPGDDDQPATIGEAWQHPVPRSLVDEQTVPEQRGRASVADHRHPEPAYAGLNHLLGHVDLRSAPIPCF